MFLAPVCALDMLRTDSQGLDNADDRQEDQQDPAAALQEQLEYAVSCLKGWGYHLDVHNGHGAISSSCDPGVLKSVVAGLVEALRRSMSEREQQQDNASRLQSDLRVLQSVRRRLEEEKEANARDVGCLKNKLLVHEEQHKRQLRENEAQREALARQLKEAKQRQVQQEHALRKRETELEQAQRQLQGGLRRTVSSGPGSVHASGGAVAAAAAALQAFQQQHGRDVGPRREGSRPESQAGAATGDGRANCQNPGARRSAARRLTAPAVKAGGAELLVQRVADLEHELDAAQEGQEAAAEQLSAVLARADELGFGPALRGAQASGPASDGRQRQSLNSGGWAGHAGGGSRRQVAGQDAGVGHAGCAGLDQDAGLGALGLGTLHQRCQRWQDEHLLRDSGSWGLSLSASALQQRLEQQLDDASALLHEQAQALERLTTLYRQQQDTSAAQEAHIMALDARLQAALLQSSTAIAAQAEHQQEQHQHQRRRDPRQGSDERVLHNAHNTHQLLPGGQHVLQQALQPSDGGCGAPGAGVEHIAPGDVGNEARRRSVSAPGGGSSGGADQQQQFLPPLPAASGLTSGTSAVLAAAAAATGKVQAAARAGATPPVGRKVWSRSAMASPKVQLRSSMAWLGDDDEDSQEEGQDRPLAARAADVGRDVIGNVSIDSTVSAAFPHEGRRRPVNVTGANGLGSRERARRATDDLASAFSGFGGQQRRQRAGLGQAERVRPAPLDLMTHQTPAACQGDSSDQADTPVLQAPDSGVPQLWR